jgi:hypothetical protein
VHISGRGSGHAFSQVPSGFASLKPTYDAQGCNKNVKTKTNKKLIIRFTIKFIF